MSFFLYFIFLVIIYSSKNFKITEENDTIKNNFNNSNIEDQKISQNKNKTNVNDYEAEKKETRKLQTEEFQEFRLEVNYSLLIKTIETNYVLGSVMEDKETIKSSIEKAKEHLLKLVSMVEKSDNNNISISKDDIKNKSLLQYLNESIYNTYNCNLVIFIIGTTNSPAENSFATPYILKNNAKGRPIFGLIDYYILYTKNNIEEKERLLIINFLHEFTHILGFEKSCLKKNNLLGIKTLTRINNGKDNIKKLMVNGTEVLKKAKKYYNCTNIDGLDLDSKSTDFEGEEFFHWEGRILLGEYMTSEIYFPEQVISEFTLDLLYELGWYKVNYYTGGLMRFGKNKGCEFINNDCVKVVGENIINSAFQNEFCDQGSNIDKSYGTCSSGRLSRGYCYNNEDYDELFKRENWDEHYGEKNAEYCPVSLETKNKRNKNYFIGSCSLGVHNYGKELSVKKDYNEEYNFFGEKNGNNSLCALSSLYKKNKSGAYKGFVHPICYPMYCSNSSLTVQINNEYLVCPKEGGLIKINENSTSNYTGYLFCPDYNLICSGSIFCNDMLDCIEKQSIDKNLDYYYIPNNITSQVTSDKRNNTDLDNFTIKEGFELSEEENTTCPKNCSHCISNKRCILCGNENKYYISERDDENHPINCSFDYPKDGYYEKVPNHFFRCSNGCKNCSDYDQCNQCFPEFKKNNNVCVERIKQCIKYNISDIFKDPNNNYGDAYNSCVECNTSNNYYCIDENRNECKYIKEEEIKQYYKIENISYSCFEKCDEKYRHCLECNETGCIKCPFSHNLSDSRNSCLFDFDHKPPDDYCKISTHPLNCDIEALNLNDFIQYYFNNTFNYINTIDFFVNEKYTVAMFINSDCTDELFNQGYYQIDSKDLYYEMSKKTQVETNEFLISIFVTYNNQNHFRFYDVAKKYLEPEKKCKSCLDIPYIIKNKYNSSINKIFGPIFTYIVINEKIDIFQKESKVFTDLCQNMTLIGIDIPLSERLDYFYLNEYAANLACSGDCEIQEINIEESAGICKCKLGNKFEDILKEFELKNYEDENKKSTSFGETLSIIKCFKGGFKAKNIKENVGFYLSLFAIIGEGGLCIFFFLCSKPITLTTIVNPPPKLKNKLRLNINWEDEEEDEKEKNKKNKNNKKIVNIEELCDYQPRDGLEDDLYFLEKSFTNDYLDSSYSIDTVLFGRSGKSKLKDGKKKVLVLLPGDKDKKDKKRKKGIDEQENLSDITPVSSEKSEPKTFCQIYWYVLSLKQHIINFFSFLTCCKITESYVPFPLRITRSIFMIILSFLFNVLFLNQNYYIKKFKYFNQKYKLIAGITDGITILPEEVSGDIPSSELWKYSLIHTLVFSIIVFLLLLVAQFLIGICFFSMRTKVIEVVKSNNTSNANELENQARIRYIIFFIITLVLLLIFMFTFVGFGGAYGGGFRDYIISGIFSLIFLEIFPFLWSLIIALLRFIGIKKRNKICFKISRFFMF